MGELRESSPQAYGWPLLSLQLCLLSGASKPNSLIFSPATCASALEELSRRSDEHSASVLMDA